MKPDNLKVAMQLARHGSNFDDVRVGLRDPGGDPTLVIDIGGSEFWVVSNNSKFDIVVDGECVFHGNTFVDVLSYVWSKNDQVHRPSLPLSEIGDLLKAAQRRFPDALMTPLLYGIRVENVARGGGRHEIENFAQVDDGFFVTNADLEGEHSFEECLDAIQRMSEEAL